MKNTITQIKGYKGWKMYRQTRGYINGYGKPCDMLWYYAVKDGEYFTGSKKDIIGFIESGIEASQLNDHVNTMLNPSSSYYA